MIWATNMKRRANKVLYQIIIRDKLISMIKTPYTATPYTATPYTDIRHNK